MDEDNPAVVVVVVVVVEQMHLGRYHNFAYVALVGSLDSLLFLNEEENERQFKFFFKSKHSKKTCRRRR